MSFSRNIAIFLPKDFFNYRLLRDKLDALLSQTRSDVNFNITGEKGTALIMAYATQRGFTTTDNLPDWEIDGNTAGYKRNAQMIQNSEATIIFGAHQSGLINEARRQSAKLRIIKLEA